VSAIYALYPDGDAAQRAVNGLRQAGLDDSVITVISDQPMEAYEFGDMDKQTRIWYIASAGGFVGLAFSTWLTRMTELAWPLPTGNMPIVAWWPNMIVMFEMTMLCAILATVATLLVTGGLVRRRPALYDPQVSSGKILVGVQNPSKADEVERALMAAGGSPLRTRAD
jgi:ActD protein